MKNKISILVLLFFAGSLTIFAQSIDKSWEYLLIRDDFVKPSMTDHYEASLSDLAMFLEENDVKQVNYITQLQDNYTYSHVSVINNLDDINGGLKDFIHGEKRSAEFDLIWDDLNQTIEGYRYYVVKYEPELSYVPDGKVWLEDAPFRRWNYLYFEPGTEDEANDIILAWKNLYENKGVKNGFRVFKGVVGLEQPVILFTTWAKDPLDYQVKLQDNMGLLGDEGAILWMAMMQIVSDVEVVEGWFLPQYSYLPKYE
jgi:hypothetical protein